MPATPHWIPELFSLCANFAESASNAALVFSDLPTLQAHACQSVLPAAVCTPLNAAQAAALLRFAGTRGIPVLPRGGGTAQGIGSPPPPDALVLSTCRLTFGFAHEPADIIATIPAGMTLGEAQQRLHTNGQWLPLDGPAAATLGGLTATDHAGALAHGYGTLRDMVLGMTVINGDGTIRKCGGKVVKNVTGYALDKLYIGSQGTLGLITEITFKLRPLPIGRDTWVLPCADSGGAASTLRAVARKNLPLESLHAVLSRNKPPRLLASAAGTPAELDRIHSELLASVAPQIPLRTPATTHWQPARSHAAHATGAQESFATLRFWCLASCLDLVLAAVESVYDCMDFHIQGGAAALRCTTPQALDVAAKLSAAGVNFRFENLRGLELREPFGPPRPDWPLMTQLRAALDPYGILNPGRFIVQR